MDHHQAICNIRYVGLARSGRPRFWCITHRVDASASGGIKCEFTPSEKIATQIDLDPSEYPGGIALWGAVAPVYDTTNMPPESGVHLHARRQKGEDKEIDDTFDIVTFPFKRDLVHSSQARVDGDAAVAYYLSNFVGNKIECVFCSHCGEPHLDKAEFAFKLHKKHLCHACGRHFSAKHPCVSNPLALLRNEMQGRRPACEPILSGRSISISQAEYPGGIQLWASNPAIIWLADRSEEAGIHVHTYDASGKRVIDDTFGRVDIDGVNIAIDEVAHLMAQQTAPWLSSRIVALNCNKCSSPLFSRGRLAFEPTRELACTGCGAVQSISGRRAVISNPLVAKLECLARGAVGGLMKGYIYITGTNTDPAALQNLNDPVFSPVPSLGACMPNIRRAVSLGDHIFVVSGSTRGVQQYVVGGFKVAEKISALAAHGRFPENRLKLDENGKLEGNVIIDSSGNQHHLDRHNPETFQKRIKDFIVGTDAVHLTTPNQVARGRAETLDRLSDILNRPRANRIIDLMGRWKRLDEAQINKTLDWLRGITATAH